MERSRTRRFRQIRERVLEVALDIERERNFQLTNKLAEAKDTLDKSQTAVAVLVRGRCDAPFFPSNN